MQVQRGQRDDPSRRLRIARYAFSKCRPEDLARLRQIADDPMNHVRATHSAAGVVGARLTLAMRVVEQTRQAFQPSGKRRRIVDAFEDALVVEKDLLPRAQCVEVQALSAL